MFKSDMNVNCFIRTTMLPFPKGSMLESDNSYLKDDLKRSAHTLPHRPQYLRITSGKYTINFPLPT